MAQYWVITPYYSGDSEVFDHSWEFDLENGTIAIGWTNIGDINGMDWEEVAERVEEWRKERKYSVTERSIRLDTNMIWKFHNVIDVGDKIIARRGRKRMLAVGTVTRTAYFDKKKGTERVGPDGSPYCRFIDVKWQEKPVEFDDVTFGMSTLTGPFDEDYYLQLVEGLDETPEDTQDTFRFEKHLEDFLVANMNRIFRGEYELYVDEDGIPGMQYSVYGDSGALIGRIDVLARKKDDGSFLVIELKRDQGPDKTVSQVMRYMAWVQKNLRKEVRGLIICKDSDERMEYALEFMKDRVDVKYYTVTFDLHDEPQS